MNLVQANSDFLNFYFIENKSHQTASFLYIKIRKWCMGSVLKSFNKMFRVSRVLILRRLLEKTIYFLSDVI